MRPTEITLAIFEKYAPQELAETAAKMAQAQADMETVEAEKKTSDGMFNERIKTHAAAVSEHAQKYNKGGETAQIGCTIRYDIPAIGQKSYWRMDREEMVEQHEMSLSEKQETLQFPLTAAPAEEPKPAKPASGEPKTEAAPVAEAALAEEPKPTTLTFKDIQAIAARILQVDADLQHIAFEDMHVKIAQAILAQKSIVGPDGRVEQIETFNEAAKLSAAWLELAIAEHNKPAQAEEVTRLCPYPGCILFAEHDGNHEFPKNAEPGENPPTDTAAQPQAEPEKKPRKRRPHAPPDAPPPQPGAPA